MCIRDRVYTAEGSYSADGKHIIYTAADHSDPNARPNYDLYWMNIETGKTTRLTFAPGQDVLVKLDALPELTLPAKLNQISPLAEVSFNRCV